VAKKSFKETLLESDSKKKKSRAITIRLPAEVDLEIRKLSEKTGRTVTEVIIQALRFALEIPA
jgi:predicted DNA-binding protein